MTEWKTYRKKPLLVKARKMNEKFWVKTLEGLMTGKPGDYLVKGIAGEKYPVDANIFHATYEEEAPPQP